MWHHHWTGNCCSAASCKLIGGRPTLPCLQAALCPSSWGVWLSGGSTGPSPLGIQPSPFHHQWALPWQPENQVSDHWTLFKAWLSDFADILQVCPFIWHPISGTPSYTIFWLPDATLLHFSAHFTFPLKRHSFLKLLKLLKHVFLLYFLLVLILLVFSFIFYCF